MKRLISLLVLSGIACTTQADIISSDQPTRLTFPPGETSITVSGSMKDKADQVLYVLRIREDQTLDIEQINENLHYVTTVLTNSKQEEVGTTTTDSPCQSSKHLSNSTAGDYILKVKQCAKAEAWQGSFKLKIKVR
jgi:uncharacterized protein YgbK (DUF1537 family)